MSKTKFITPKKRDWAEKSPFSSFASEKPKKKQKMELICVIELMHLRDN